MSNRNGDLTFTPRFPTSLGDVEPPVFKLLSKEARAEAENSLSVPLDVDNWLIADLDGPDFDGPEGQND